MTFLKSITTILLCLFVAANCYAQDGGTVEDQADNKLAAVAGEDNVVMKNKTIGQIVMESEQFTVTETALETATMLEMFQRGEYTLIAPTDDAWDEVLDTGEFEPWFKEHENAINHHP